jgi:hypothetical protein
MIKIFTKIPKIILIFLFFLFSNISLASDDKPGRFFEDQPDVSDDYQIHFLYTLAKDGEDREWDINGKMEAMLLEMNEIMARETEKKSKGESKKYKFDYRKDGKLDITFLRLDKNFKDLDRKSSINNNISAFLWLKRLNNPKKIYFSFSDMGGRDGGEAGVTQGSTFLRHSSVGSKDNIIKVTLHELIHAQGGGFNCVPGVSNQHLTNWTKGYQLTKGHKLSSIYIHKVEGCPQLVDSVYLTPTSKNPYDPYKLICDRELGKYTHKKIIKAFDKQNKVVAKGKWRPQGFGAYCKWQPGPDFEYFTDATAAEQHYQNCDATKCKKARFEKSN